jgi:exonuclease III
MKIATFNINNVVRRPNLLAWLRAGEPEVVCLQAAEGRGRRPVKPLPDTCATGVSLFAADRF